VASKTAVWSLPPPVGVTVRDRAAERTVDPLVPWTWTGNVPVAVDADTATVRLLVALPLAGGVTEAGLKLHVAPLGSPEQDRETALAKPFVELTVHVLVPLAPCWTLRLEGLHETLKSGGGGVPPQLGNLWLETRVDQLKLPVAFRYSVVNQKVQSSTGSTVIAL
jgi:hypothetical protein